MSYVVYDYDTECIHDWNPATCTKPRTCTKCGKTDGSPLGHCWMDAYCTKPKYCAICGQTEGEELGHDWIEATITTPRTCRRCGDTEGTALGQETPWEYSNENTHREKTMYDGTVLKEDLIICGNYSAWGYFDDEAASAMNEAVNDILVNEKGLNPFNISISYYDKAHRNAVAYSIRNSSHLSYDVGAYHANFGGLPNVDKDKLYITLSDGYNEDNYIGCFVRDGYQGNGDCTYGEYWRYCFGTYYATGNF